MNILHRVALAGGAALIALTPADANHSWNGYHWAGNGTNLTLRINTAIASKWDDSVTTAISDWNQSTELTLNGQPASVDTHNGIIEGIVTRIDPAVQNGTVAVDIQLNGHVEGERPDLSVDGTIDLERLADVLYVGRPAFGNENSTISLFRLEPDGSNALRTPVKVGRASVNAIQVLSGLKEGDTVILSDMSRWDSANRIRLD